MSKKPTKETRYPRGFAESTEQKPFAASSGLEIAPGKFPPLEPYKPAPRVRAKVGPGGRIVIPAAFRAAADMEEGADVWLTLEGKEVRVITPLAMARRAQESCMKLAVPGVSVVDELIADRIAEDLAESQDD